MTSSEFSLGGLSALTEFGLGTDSTAGAGVWDFCLGIETLGSIYIDIDGFFTWVFPIIFFLVIILG
jgi:hypothetical protein